MVKKKKGYLILMVIITMTLLAGCQAQFQSANATEIQKPFVSNDKSIPGTLNVDIDGNKETLNNESADMLDIDSTATTIIVDEDLESWGGDYFFEEVGSPTHHCMEYNIVIYSEGGKYYANISMDGWLTMNRLKAQVIGDDKFIQFVFCEYLPDSYVPEYAQIEVGIVLLSFERKGSELLTYWGYIKSFNPENEKSGKVYFEYVIENSQQNKNPYLSEDDIKNGEIIEDTQYYKIIHSGFMFYYYIFDENHDVVESDGPLDRQPCISMVDDHLVRFTLQAGTGIGTQWGYYYDTKRDVFSRIFQSIFDQSDGKVAFGGLDKIIVRDIFDKTTYCREFTEFKNELSDAVDPFVNVEFVNDSTQIQVTYLTGKDYNEITEIIELY